MALRELARKAASITSPTIGTSPTEVAMARLRSMRCVSHAGILEKKGEGEGGERENGRAQCERAVVGTDGE